MEDASPADYDNPDDWEVVNDAGFAFKRKKRSHIDLAASAAPPPPDPSSERKIRRLRKKRVLLKVTERLKREIGQWKILSNTLKALENSSARRVESVQTTPCDGPSSSGEHLESNSCFPRVIDDLLCQVEKQEAIIRDVSKLCGLAEELCTARQERSKQMFSDLLVWEPSPSEIMGALCER